MDVISTGQLTRVSCAAPGHYAADFDGRWVAWVARGRAHEQHVRDAFLLWGSIIAAGAGVVYAFLRA